MKRLSRGLEDRISLKEVLLN